jgi:capsular polysaccharide biosynthesis protein
LEQELDLLAIWQVIVKRWVIILLFPLLAGIGSYSYGTYTHVPMYHASTTLLVLQPETTAQMYYSDILLSRQLVATYGEIVRSNTVLNKAAANLNYPHGAGGLRGQVSVSAVGETEIINISVINPNPEMARDIANEVAGVFIKEVVNIYKVDNVSLIDEAVTPSGR